MTRVEILYFAGCPAYRRAKQNAVAAMRAAGLAGEPAMRLVRNLRDAKDLDFHGSPTVRVDGRDIDPPGAQNSPEVGLYSRSFKWGRKTFDAPPPEMVSAALARRGPPPP